MLFTGYEMAEITEKQMTSILDYLDILITGRYEKAKRTMNHQWIGSTNQEIHFLTDRYADYKIENNNYTEITINEDASLTILGFHNSKHLNMRPTLLQTHCQSYTYSAKTKFCQRALQSQHREKLFKNLPTLKKIKMLTHKPTEKEESKMTMTRKLNNDNGLQDWKTEHQA